MLCARWSDGMCCVHETCSLRDLSAEHGSASVMRCRGTQSTGMLWRFENKLRHVNEWLEWRKRPAPTLTPLSHTAAHSLIVSNPSSIPSALVVSPFRTPCNRRSQASFLSRSSGVFAITTARAGGSARSCTTNKRSLPNCPRKRARCWSPSWRSRLWNRSGRASSSSAAVCLSSSVCQFRFEVVEASDSRLFGGR